VHLLPYVACSLLMLWYTWRWYTAPSERRFPWRSMLLERGAWHIYTLGLVNALLRREVPWVPTPKTSDHSAALGIALPNIAAVGLSIAAIAYPWFAYHRIDGGTVLMMFFAAVNVATLAPSIAWAAWPPRNREHCGPVQPEECA